MAREQHTRDNPGRYFEKSNGYWIVSWQENRKRICMLEHRWVWEQANGPIPKGHQIHHIDHDRNNNALSNLQCMTAREHIQLHRQEEGKQTYDSVEAAYAANVEYRREYQRQWREANRDAINGHQREYRAKRKLELAASTGS
jgi:hypothetical protein